MVYATNCIDNKGKFDLVHSCIPDDNHYVIKVPDD